MSNRTPLILLTSNQNKLNEFQRLFKGVELVMQPGPDLREVDSDADTVALYKSRDAGPNTLTEDTILLVNGEEVVDIRYCLETVAQTQAEALWRTTLSVNTGTHIELYVGEVPGTLVPMSNPPKEAFGFDPYFVPKGTRASLHELAQQGDKDRYSARANAVTQFRNNRPWRRIRIEDLPRWSGNYQT